MNNRATTPDLDDTFIEYCDSNQVNQIPQDKVVLKKPTPQINTKTKTYQQRPDDLAFFGILDSITIKSEYCNDGQHQVVKALRLGKYRVIASLDLHNHTQGEALQALEAFLDNGITTGTTCLKIVHGKGLNSPDGASVLKSLVRRFLIDYPRLIAYSKASGRDGGDGVTLIKLKTTAMSSRT